MAFVGQQVANMVRQRVAPVILVRIVLFVIMIVIVAQVIVRMVPVIFCVAMPMEQDVIVVRVQRIVSVAQEIVILDCAKLQKLTVRLVIRMETVVLVIV